MKQIAQFEMANFNISMKYGTEIDLQPFGDIHRFTPACAVDKWKAFLKFARKKHTSQSLYISLGDHDDFAAMSDRHIMRDLHGSTKATIDKDMAHKCREMANELEFMRGQLLGMVEGNHYWVFDKEINDGALNGKTSTQYMCELLGCRWLGSLCYVITSIACGGKRFSVKIVANHGKAGGKLLGTTLNQVDDMTAIFPDADIYLMGHDHRRGGLPKTHLWVANYHGKMHLHQRRQWIARTGSFQKSYEEGVESYPVSKLMRPSDLGIVRFGIGMARSRHNGVDLIVPDIHMWA